MAPDLLVPVQSLLRGQTGIDDVEQALEQGASPNAWQGPLTPVRCAVQAHHLRLLQLLLRRGADTNQKDNRGVGPLHMAVFDGKSECIKLLLDNVADPNITDRHGQTPLFFAPTRQVCELLISRRADVNVRNAKKQSPLHLAAHAGLNDAVSWFVDVNKQILAAQDAQGHTPLYYAAHSKVKSTVSVLQRKAADASHPTRNSGTGARGPQEAPREEQEAPPPLPSAGLKGEAQIASAEATEEPELLEAAAPELPPPSPPEGAHEEGGGDDDDVDLKAAPPPAEQPPAETAPAGAAPGDAPAAGEAQAASSADAPAEAARPPSADGVPKVTFSPSLAESQRTVAARTAAAMRARNLAMTPPASQRAGSPFGSQQARSLPPNAFEVESENSEEARAENRVPNKEVKQELVDGCLVWEVMLKKESAQDKFGFVQANGKLEFETRLANPSHRAAQQGQAPPTLKGPEASPLPGPSVLIVRRINEGALLHRWNQKYPHIAVKAQDRIVSINGETSLEGMQFEIRSAKIFIKFVRYPETFSVTVRKGERRLGFRFERPPPGARHEEVRLTEVLAEGAMPQYNKGQVEAGKYHYTVLPDMRITKANNISGDGAEIAEELKRCNEVTLEIRRAEGSAANQAKTKMRMLARMMSGGGQSVSPGSRGASPSNVAAAAAGSASGGSRSVSPDARGTVSSQEGSPSS